MQALQVRLPQRPKSCCSLHLRAALLPLCTGEEETVDAVHLSPNDLPVDFGAEKVPLQVREAWRGLKGSMGCSNTTGTPSTCQGM
jgi:hypothetical protein